jgi:hypothetical protein
MLYTDDLWRILSNDKRTASSFRGVFACDELPVSTSTSSLYVCNTDPSTKGGEHWVVIYVDDNRRAEFFDSFGMSPTKERFETFLNNVSASWVFNARSVQYPLSDACGYHCVFFAVHRCVGFNINAVVNMYTHNLMYNDVLVKQFVREKIWQ